MAYTTVTKVRQSGGFVGNNNISDAFIANQIARAEAKINSKLSDAYVLPVGKYYSQTIVFSGTGTGSADLTITINSTNYVVAITNGLTASQAADKFRLEAADNDDFVTDALGSGSTVIFYTVNPNDSTKVLITSTDPQTVQGITVTGGTATEATVPLLEMLATEIAVAFLLITEYGPEAQDTDKDGFKRLAIWEKDLNAIGRKEQKVFNFAGTEIAKSATKLPSFFPTDASNVDTQNPTNSRFTMNKVF